jgi:hypothetical protein
MYLASGHSAESHELQLKARSNLERKLFRQIYIYKLHYPSHLPSMLEIPPGLANKIDSALRATAQIYIQILIPW